METFDYVLRYHVSRSEGNAMTASLRAVWKEVPTDPDPESDLGYRTEPLLVIDGPEGGNQLIFLPAEEAQLHDDEFIVADADCVVPLEECR